MVGSTLREESIAASVLPLRLTLAELQGVKVQNAANRIRLSFTAETLHFGLLPLASPPKFTSGVKRLQQ